LLDKEAARAALEEALRALRAGQEQALQILEGRLDAHRRAAHAKLLARLYKAKARRQAALEAEEGTFRSYEYYSAFTYTAEAIVGYCADITSDKSIITEEEETNLARAAVFFIQEARKHEKNVDAFKRRKVGLDSRLDATADKLYQLLRSTRA
jgi:hypothetical protein